ADLRGLAGEPQWIAFPTRQYFLDMHVRFICVLALARRWRDRTALQPRALLRVRNELRDKRIEGDAAHVHGNRAVHQAAPVMIGAIARSHTDVDLVPDREILGVK